MTTDDVPMSLHISQEMLDQVIRYQAAQGLDSASAAVVDILMKFFRVDKDACLVRPATGEERGAIAPLSSPTDSQDDIEDEPDEILYDFLEPDF